MDALLTAFIGDLASRSLSFLIDRYLINKAEPSKEERLDSLQRLLLRVRVVVDEVGGRHVTNQAMLQQLSSLRNDMYRGYFTLDATRCRANHRDGDVHQSEDAVPWKLAAELNGCFLSANMLGGLLRSNVDVGFWRAAVTTLREFNRMNHHEMMTTPEPYQWGLYSAMHVPSMSEHVVVLDDYQLTGSTSAHDYSYVLKCEIRRTKHVVARKRRTP